VESVVMSVALNALLLYPDRPFRLGSLFGWNSTRRRSGREKFLIAQTPDLSETKCTRRAPLGEEESRVGPWSSVPEAIAVYTQKSEM